MDRRAFLTGLASLSAAFYARAAAAEPGISASPEFFQAFTGLRGVSEGAGRGTMHVLFAPWCPLTPQLYSATRPFVGRMRINWIPFAGGQPEGRYGTEYLLRSGSPADVPSSFTRIKQVMPINVTPMSDAQDNALGSIMPLYYRDVGGSLATPTVFYRMQGDRIRVLKGAPQPAHIEQIAFLAS